MRLTFGEPLFAWLALAIVAAGLGALLPRRTCLGRAWCLLVALLVSLALSRPVFTVSRTGTRPEVSFLLVHEPDGAAETGQPTDVVAETLKELRAESTAGNWRQIGAADRGVWVVLMAALAEEPSAAPRRVVWRTRGHVPPAERSRLLDFAAHCGMPIDVVPVIPAAREVPAIDRVWIRNRRLRIGDSLVADLTVVGGRAPSLVGMMIDGRTVSTVRVSPGPGARMLRFTHKAQDPGWHLLAAKILDPPSRASDSPPFEQRFLVDGQRQLLVVAGNPEEARSLTSALAADGLRTTVVVPREMPGLADGLAPFDATILYDVPPLLTEAQDAALGTYVAEMGRTLVFICGPMGFSFGAWQGTHTGSLLPVLPHVPKDAEQYRVALGLVLDTSGSMAEGSGEAQKLSLVARATRQAVERLKAGQDEVGVLAFAGQPRWLQPWGKLGTAEKVAQNLTRLMPGGETDLLPALHTMGMAIVQSTAQIRHILVLSDGQTASSAEDLVRLVKYLKSNGITLSTVAVGLSANEDLMSGLAHYGGGQFYRTRTPDELVDVLTQDTQRHARSGILEEPATAHVVSDGLWRGGLRLEDAPPLLGYVVSRVAPHGRVAIQTDRQMPLLVWGTRGLGRVGFFASDAGERWARLWLEGWAGYSAFWAQTVRFLVPAREAELTAHLDDGCLGEGLRIELMRDYHPSEWPEEFAVKGETGEADPQGRISPLGPHRLWGEVKPRRASDATLLVLTGRRPSIELVPEAGPLTSHLTPEETFLRSLAAASGGFYAPMALERRGGPPGSASYALSSALLVLLGFALLIHSTGARSKP